MSQWYVDQGAPRDKIVMGWAANGKSFTLADPDNRGMGAPITGRGIGEAAANGTLFYYEVSDPPVRSSYITLSLYDKSITASQALPLVQYKYKTT